MAFNTDSTLSFIAGPFNIWMRYRGASGSDWYPLGIISKEDGLVVTDTLHGETIDGDNEGQTVQDGVTAGASAMVAFTLKQAKSKALVSVMAMATRAGRAASGSDAQTADILAGTTDLDEMWGTVPASGVLWSKFAVQIVAIPIFGCTPVSDTADGGMETLPIFHFGKCVREENGNIEYALKHNLRTIPLKFRCLPFTGNDSRLHLYEKINAIGDAF